MNVFFGLPPEGITVFLGFGPDCSLFSQKELPQGSGRVWFVTSEAQPLEICQASVFEWYTLPFNGNLLPLSQAHTQFQAGGTTLSWKISASQVHSCCLWAVMGLWDASASPGMWQMPGCLLHSRTSASYCSHAGWLWTLGSVSLSGPSLSGDGKAADPPNHCTALCQCHQASHVLGMMTQLNQDFQSVAWCFVGSGSLKQTSP